MSFNILHLNVERDRHTEAVLNLLKDKNPEIVCLAEAMEKDVKMFALELGYKFAFVPRVFLKYGENVEGEGSAILSKYPILEVKEYPYHDDLSLSPPTIDRENITTKNYERPVDRFSHHYTLLSVVLNLDKNKNVHICTTHFPVTDHTTPGYKNHEVQDSQNIIDLARSETYFDKLINSIRGVQGPTVFTADLNNSRGEYFYDKLAHELIDRVPISLASSLDPALHRMKGLELMVDTVMTSEDVSLKNFEIIEGVSDHKAFFVTLEV